MQNDSKDQNKTTGEAFETIYIFISHLLFITFIVVSFLRLERQEQIIVLLAFVASPLVSLFITLLVDTFIKPEQASNKNILSKQEDPEEKDK